MRVLVTGGTGHVGAHTVAALTAAGHQVRLLVRNPAKLAIALGPLGLAEPDHLVGDVTDPASVSAAVAGCDAAVHAAAVVTFERSRVAEAARVNSEATRRVLGTAVDGGLDPVVYVSSVSAFHPPVDKVLTRDSPVGVSDEVYAGTKAGGEAAARELQGGGAPVVITYPGGIWGPFDPNFGEQTRAVVWMARTPILPDVGGYLVVDVRDVAAIHTACMVPALGPRRYTAGGTFFTGSELARLFSAVTGRRAMGAPTPPVVLRGLGRIGDLVNVRLRLPLPFTVEGMDTLVRSVPTDDSATKQELGVAFRPASETVADTLRWLYAEGRLSARLVGRVAAG